MTKLTGNRTYILCALGILATIAYWFGMLPEKTYLSLLGLLGSGAGIALRSAVKKIE